MARLKAIESRFGFRYGGLLATEGLGMKVFLARECRKIHANGRRAEG